MFFLQFFLQVVKKVIPVPYPFGNISVPKSNQQFVLCKHDKTNTALGFQTTSSLKWKCCVFLLVPFNPFV